MILYEIGTTDFSKNGLGYLPNVLNTKVVDEINGEYSLTFEYPINEDMAKEIYEDRIVKCKVSDGTQQCFVIKTIQKNFNVMKVYCTHLFYMLNDNFVENTYPQNLSPKPFLDHILANANYQLPFATNSDIVATATARYVRKNIVETILGDISNSMYNLFGMELKRDNWNIGLKARLGTDKGEKLIFGKNITGVDVSVDTTGIYTRIMPIGFDGLLLPEKFVDASNINDYPYPRICLYEFPEIRYSDNLEDTEAYHTLADAYQALRDAVAKLYDEGINLPLINISINWLELSKTEEYKQYSALERVDLGDTLTCNLFGMDYETRVIKTTYNPLTDRIEKFEIGTSRPSITNTITRNEVDIQNLPSSILEEATENATELITQAMGGYVYKTNNELYIMDNPDPNQAVKVWRWNLNGLGYSSTGINGTYGLAMTMDGSIVADFITTGQLSANVINASTIIGVINGNTSQLKLQADQLDLNGAVTANNNFIINQDGSVEMNNGYITLTDNPSDTEDRFIIWANDKSRLMSATSEYVIVRTYDENNPNSTYYSYAQLYDEGRVSWGDTTDSNNGTSGSCREDFITLTKKVNGTITRSTYASDGATINGLINTPTHKQYFLNSKGDNNYPEYYLIAKFPADDGANHAIIRINGIFGGWGSDRCVVDFFVGNRGGFRIKGSYYGFLDGFNCYDFKCYQDNNEIYLYLHRKAQWTSEVILNVMCEQATYYGNTTSSYPSGTDIYTIDNQTLDGDTGWIDCTLTSDFSQVSWNVLKYRKKNGIVTIVGTINTNVTTYWGQTITNLPDGFRPIGEFDIVCRSSYWQVMKIAIATNGDIIVLELNDGSQLPANNTIFISATYIVD